jgi:hypothetical protein
MDSSMMRRVLHLGPLCLLLFFAVVGAAQELPPMAVQASLLPASGGQHKLYLTLGNRTNLGMDTVKVTIVSNGGESVFGTIPTLNPYQWQTMSGAVSDADSVAVVEYILNDKPQKLSVPLNSGGSSGFGRGMPSLLWLGGAALLGAFLATAGAAAGRRGR